MNDQTTVKPAVEILEGLVTTQYLCKLFQRSPLTIFMWRSREGLPYVRVPGAARDTIRYRLEAVLEWARGKGKRTHVLVEEGE